MEDIWDLNIYIFVTMSIEKLIELQIVSPRKVLVL